MNNRPVERELVDFCLLMKDPVAIVPFVKPTAAGRCVCPPQKPGANLPPRNLDRPGLASIA